MSANEDFFRERRAQAVFKHGILTRYPHVFAAKTGFGGRAVAFVDGYAGRGEYDNHVPGSPLLLARTARNVESFRQVRLFFVERDEEDFQNLQQVVGPYLRAEDRVLPGDLEVNLPSILQLTQGMALFMFLDPFGTALKRSELVNRVLKRPGAPVEVLLHISVSTVARLGGLLRKRRKAGVAVLDPKDAKSIAHVDRFLGDEWWQEHFEPITEADNDEERASDAALRVAELFQRGVCAETGCRAVSVPVRRHPDHKPKYVLVLFTRSDDGVWHFADALGKAGREWEGAWRGEVTGRAQVKAEKKYANAGQGLFELAELFQQAEPFDPDRYETEHRGEWTATITANIRQLLASRGAFRLPDRISEVYGPVLAAASARHVTAAVRNLHAAGEILNDPKNDKNFFRTTIRPALS